MANKITVTSLGTTANVNATPDSARYYSDKSKEWAISDKLIDNEDYSSKYYANESKKQADISTAKTTEVVESGNTALSNIDTAEANALTDITDLKNTSISNITTAKNNAITTINTEKTNAVNAVKTQQSTSISAVQNQQNSSVNTVKSTGQSYVDKCKAWASSPNVIEGGLRSAKYYAEMAQGKSDVTYETLRASRAYEDKGALLTDEQGYAEVAKYKRSTFDLSKFTVVGSPTITDDGIASGFSINNYLAIPLSVNTTSFKFNFNFTTSSIMTENYLFGGNLVSERRIMVYAGSYGLSVDIYKLDGTHTSIATNLHSMLNINTVYSGYIKYDGNKYTVGLKTQDESIYTVQETISDFISDIDNIYVRPFGAGNSDFSIDLKQFSITVDGKEVFNGNKTGLDVIKADNYEVVGSPVISEDGVASGFSAGNYLKSINIDFTKPWKIISKFNTGNLSTHNYLWGLPGGGWYNYVYFSAVIAPNITLQLSDNTTFVLKTNELPILLPYTNYTIIIEWTGTQYKLVIKDILNNNLGSGVYSSNLPLKQENSIVRIGQGSSGNYYFQGSIDLNAFKIYVDGKLVYQPCLKIPYTQSKTGSKIMDVAYRDRVIDLYEQEGQAGYYTIDEENKNFTLPMGEIYGMIGQRSLISSTVTETNRVDIYSDKTCLICGNVATAGTINLPIELVNKNYFITLSTSAKTATSFTTTATGDYILIGKVI